MYQNLSVSIAQADVDAVFAAIATLEEKLPFLITLESQERRAITKLGSRSADFVKDALEAVIALPTVVPSSFNIEEFKKDAALFEFLSRIKFKLDILCEKVDHTHMASGNEAMTSALETYSYVRTASKRTPGLQSVADKLQDRFRKQGRRRNGDVSSDAPK
ncbi:hypothetical protein [Chryseolinea lacunae]|uniref:Uncharacterized protein n=1 Tax=Chryseolinea lacunae TaxID=2801331 RepID=A0ABS1KKX9_9BACT|nr:hypothetical protein [Chryseolinea lacunae]MBL0739877.1 hypothetical protein [Chryseolinea lacunae]